LGASNYVSCNCWSINFFAIDCDFCANHLLQVEAQSAIGSDNIGHKLLQKMGWKEGKGIGAKEDGRTAPVAAGGSGGAGAAAGMRQDTLGLGAQAHGAVEANDDPFEQYRKRMQLGYK
jgi:splicing factor 4